MGILARLRLAKIRNMARPNSPDMPPANAYQKGMIRYNDKDVVEPASLVRIGDMLVEFFFAYLN